MKKILKNKYLFISIFVYLCLVSPFWSSIPYLDGNIDFVKTYDFYSGGFDKLFANWKSVHPPLKEITVSLIYKTVGVSVYSYNLTGVFFGILGISFFYLLVGKIFEKKISQISTVLLATSPLFISVGFFALTDFILTTLLLMSFYFYLSRKYPYFALFASLSVLAKETGLVFIFSIVLVEVLFLIRRYFSQGKLKLKISKIFSLTFPFFVSFLWYSFLTSKGKGLWSDWNFSSVSEKGSLYTVINNLYTFNFFNKYAFQNFLQLFFLNFNWLYWLVFGLGLFIFMLNKKGSVFSLLLENKSSSKAILIILVFSFSYFLSILTFQTYTIPRYALPLFPFLLMGVSWALEKIQRKTNTRNVYLYTFIFLLVSLRLFFSIDPISSSIWGKTTVFGEDVYALNKHLAGNDGITYNLQYLFIVKKRTELLHRPDINEDLTYRNNCPWIYPDPRNDYKTSMILSLAYELKYKCN